MKTLDTTIHELLLTHECVIVPQFGGFLTKRKSAFIDFDKGTITPPTKVLQFNLQLQQNDGLLVNAYKQDHSLSYEASVEAIENMVVNWNARLSSGGTLTLSQIGSLWKDEEGNIQFEQDRNSQMLLSAYGLEVVHFVPQAPAVVPEQVAESQVQHHQAWKYLAAAVVALPIVFYSYWIPNQTDAVASGIITLEDFNPFRKKHLGSGPKTIKVVPKAQVKQSKTNTNIEHAVKTPSIEVAPIVPPPTPIPVTITVQNIETQSAPTVHITTTFHCIAGCFVNPENAISFTDKLTAQGFQVQTLKENGLHKVSIGNSFSREGIADVQQKAQELNIESWILEKINQ
ncbi:MAG: SPOR domain-containing protein [Flavobacteriales bacterium]